MNGYTRKYVLFLLAISLACFINVTTVQAAGETVITEADCTVEKLGSSIPVTAIGEPVSGVTLKAPVWNAASGSNPAYCSVDGAMAPVSKEGNARPINFRIALPASWSGRLR